MTLSVKLDNYTLAGFIWGNNNLKREKKYVSGLKSSK